MAGDLVFTEEELAIDGSLGYPKAFAKLCRDRSYSTFNHGPPVTFMPYSQPQQEARRVQELEELFPIIDSKAKPTTKPKIFLTVLWKQLNHLGNAGFDPEVFRVDPYGNVLYFHADASSPLAWEIDHWFPCSRGGLTVVSNLRIIQWQVYKKKQNHLEFLIPWWDFQVGVSINQFLSIFASANSDFRRRAFSWLFANGESEELNASQTVDSHAFPRHFNESSQKIGLAPAAVVLSRRESSVLRSLDMNKKPRSSTPIIAARKVKPGSKENDDPRMASNPYQAIVIARDSLRQKEEATKMQAEIQKLDCEAEELEQKAEDEKLTIENLELVLMKRRRRAEKCRHLAESQTSYRRMLEKMIRDAMHQSVVYKEQVRLNQAAAGALMATLEAQKAMCDSSERELHKKFKQRDELEKQIAPSWNSQARKRSRIDDYPAEEETLNDDCLLEEQNTLYLEGPSSSRFTSHKQLKKFLEEEQKASEAEGSKAGNSSIVIEDDEREIVREDAELENIMRFSAHDEPEEEEDEESRQQRGKGNVEKWLQMLLKENGDDSSANPQIPDTADEEIVRKMDLVYPQKEARKSFSGLQKKDMVELKCRDMPIKNPPYRIIRPDKTTADNDHRRIMRQDKTTADNDHHRIIKQDKTTADEDHHRIIRPDNDHQTKEKELARSESARTFRRIPSSPSLILSGMKKRVDCMGKKPLVMDDDEEADETRNYIGQNSILKSTIKTIKRAVKM